MIFTSEHEAVSHGNIQNPEYSECIKAIGLALANQSLTLDAQARAAGLRGEARR
jgi:hypothetical protein